MFSVVVPVFNKVQTLRRTIDRALAQNFADFELIVIDDGSTDGSIDSLASIADPRLRILAQDNRGPGDARNRGIAEAQHDWIAFLDGDDIWHPDHLAELDRIRKRHPVAALIGTSFVDSDFRGRFTWSGTEQGRIESISYLEEIATNGKVFFTSSAAARREVLRTLGGFGAFPRGEDSELWVRIDLAYSIARSTRSTVVHLHGTGGITESPRLPWPGDVPAGPEDMSPAVATALAARRDAPAPLLEVIDRFINRYVLWMMDGCATRGSVEAVATIASFHCGPAPLRLRVMAHAASLPRPLARSALRTVRAAEGALGLFSRRRGASSATSRGQAAPPAFRPGA